MELENQFQLIPNELKIFEQKIVAFYFEIAKKSNINMKLTEIFSYFKIYNTLTQKQLMQLTKLSLSTISTILQLFLQSNIITREFIPKTHTNIYTLKKEDIIFSYQSLNYFTTKMNQTDKFIEEVQKKLVQLQTQHPKEANFLFLRLNGLRNYFKAQRKSRSAGDENSYLAENVSDLIQEEEFIEYPNELLKIEAEIVDYFVTNELFIENDPIINKILSYLITRMKMDQKTLITLTKFSRSEISRNLAVYRKQDYTNISKKEYLKSRIYYMNSISLYLLDVILKINFKIITWKPAFEKMLAELQLVLGNEVILKGKKFLSDKISEILNDIRNFKKVSDRLSTAQKELQMFLGKTAMN